MGIIVCEYRSRSACLTLLLLCQGELLAFAFLGLLGGLFGAAFVAFYSFGIRQVRAVSAPGRFLGKIWLLYPVLCAAVFGILSYPHTVAPFMGMIPTNEINTLFSNSPLACSPEYSSFNIFAELATAFAIRFVLTPLTVALPMPAGVFVPLFILGAIYGRFAGEMLNVWLSHSTSSCTDLPTAVSAASYAVVGAAALAAASTHTISTIVIVFELTGSIDLMLPIMLAVMIATGIAQLLSASIYDTLIMINNIPYIPNLLPGSHADAPAHEFMCRSVIMLNLDCTFENVIRAMQGNRFRAFPVVDDSGTRVLLGTVLRSRLREAVFQHLGDLSKGSDSSLPSSPSRTTHGSGHGRFHMSRLDLSVLRKQAGVVFRAAIAGAADASWKLRGTVYIFVYKCVYVYVCM